jgi:hypothetical protein
VWPCKACPARAAAAVACGALILAPEADSLSGSYHEWYYHCTVLWLFLFLLLLRCCRTFCALTPACRRHHFERYLNALIPGSNRPVVVQHRQSQMHWLLPVRKDALRESVVVVVVVCRRRRRHSVGRLAGRRSVGGFPHVLIHFIRPNVMHHPFNRQSITWTPWCAWKP